jgi:hypothetical protein
MTKSVDYLLATVMVGAVATVVGSMSWTGVVKLVATFTDIAEFLQVKPCVLSNKVIGHVYHGACKYP